MENLEIDPGTVAFQMEEKTSFTFFRDYNCYNFFYKFLEITNLQLL